MLPPPGGDGVDPSDQNVRVNPNSDILVAAAAVLAVSAASLTGFGMRQQRYRGWLWWVAALWLTTLGAALAAGSAAPATQALAGVLLMQWPIVTLLGLRRFHARQAIAGSERVDISLLVAAALLTLVAAGAYGEPRASWVGSACTGVLHLYAALLLFGGPSGRDGAPLQTLAVAQAAVAFAPVLGMAPGDGLAAPLALRAGAAALGSVVMAFVALTLVCERTERQLRESRRRLRALANLDALTQVPNRRHFHDLASLALHTDPPGSAALMLLDIDHFKHINDHLGHASGDQALTIVSASMIEHLRANDVAGRHGGDEFALLLRRADTTAAVSVAARIAAEVQTRADGAKLPRLTLSFGIVQVDPRERLEDAMRRADQAMYEAKRQGRGCAVTAAGNEARPVFSESRPLGLLSA